MVLNPITEFLMPGIKGLGLIAEGPAFVLLQIFLAQLRRNGG
jgi:hypothetical protein